MEHNKAMMAAAAAGALIAMALFAVLPRMRSVRRRRRLARRKAAVLKPYKAALAAGDIQMARAELKAIAKACPVNNRRCLKDVWCNECPFAPYVPIRPEPEPEPDDGPDTHAGPGKEEKT